MPNPCDTKVPSSAPSDDHLLTLVQAYLDICNRALVQGKDNPVVSSILRAHADEPALRSIAVDLVDDLPQKQVSVVYSDQALSVDASRVVQSPTTWRLNRSYLEQVIAHADDYIRNPARLDWEWMIDRDAANSK